MLTLDIVVKNKRNQLLLNYLGSDNYPADLEFTMDEAQLEKQISKIGTHPDVIELLWYDYTEKIAVKCQAILLGKPVLLNPETGVVFAMAEGTYPPLLRLSEAELKALLENGGKTILSDMDGIYADAGKVGRDWVYCFSFLEGLKEYFLRAYNYSK